MGKLTISSHTHTAVAGRTARMPCRRFTALPFFIVQCTLEQPTEPHFKPNEALNREMTERHTCNNKNPLTGVTRDDATRLASVDFTGAVVRQPLNAQLWCANSPVRNCALENFKYRLLDVNSARTAQKIAWLSTCTCPPRKPLQ